MSHDSGLYWTHESFGAHKLQFGAPFSVASKRLLDLAKYGQLYKKPSPPKSN